MPACEDCISYLPITKDSGTCRINGETIPEREIERCPSRTFIPKPVK